MEEEKVEIWRKHQQILENKGVDFEMIVELRRDIHKHAEGGFKEFETQRKIKEKLPPGGPTLSSYPFE